MLPKTHIAQLISRPMRSGLALSVFALLGLAMLATPETSKAQICTRKSSATDSVRANGTNNGISADSATSVEVKSGEGEESESSEMDLESSGFIVDGTQTKLGRDFYESFFSFWAQPENTGEFTIVITERPLPQRGTQVSMTVNDFLIFQAFLEPRHEAIQEMASSAVYRALGFIQNYQEALRELEGDDMEGTGLF